MDITTLGGLAAMGALLAVAFGTGEISASLLNLHAVIVVLGGTAVSLMINTPLRYLLKSLTELKVIFRADEFSDLRPITTHLVALSEQCRRNGMSALKEADTAVAKGFLNRAAMAALEYNDSNFVKQVLEQEINQATEELNEVANVYRTMSVLTPMFGLLGTLIGIISVLRELANPENVGPAMAVAITSAFYGIFFANMVCVPIAGKIRYRIWTEARAKGMILDGILEIMKGSIPMVVERRLQSYQG